MKKTAVDHARNAIGFMERVSAIIEENLSTPATEPASKILKHPVSVRGHMIRPYLAYISAMATHQEISVEQARKLEYFAASIELLHNASLIHDDVLDEEVMRRGKECLYRVFGTKNAILAGNIYYIKAIELMTRHVGTEAAINLLNTAGDMCIGEIIQQQYITEVMTEEIYFEIIKKKTAALIALACGDACKIAGGSDGISEDIRRLGLILGTIYQLQDDMKDKDANLESSFNYSHHIHMLIHELKVIIGRLPQTEYIMLYEEFLNKLKLSSKAS